MHAARYIARHHDGPARPGSYDVVTLSGADGAAFWQWWLRQEDGPAATGAVKPVPELCAMPALPPPDHDPAYAVVTLSAEPEATVACAGVVIDLG